MHDPLLLLLETSSPRCSIGISRGTSLIADQEADQPFGHAQQITLLIQACLEEAGCALQQLDGIVVSSGPGSYTSLRVGVSTAKGLCYAGSKPLIAIPTLYSLAMASRERVKETNAWFAPMIDARRQDVYWQLYDEKLNTIVDLGMRTLAPEMLPEEAPLVYLCGNGADKAEEILKSRIRKLDLDCHAEWLIRPALEAFNGGRFEDIAYFEPLYVTAPNITKPKKSW